jgi:AcrR family transcriptional regulator
MAPRTAQKNRTRSALLAAASKLIEDGEAITIARVADAAEISRATAYRYFSDPGTLTAEVTLDIQLRSTDDVLEGIKDPRQRVHAIAHYYLTFIRQHEGQFRNFLAQTMRHWAEQSEIPLRGARRVGAFSQALEPVRSQMKPADFTDLVHRLSMLTGLEQHIVLRDVLGVEPDEGDRLQAGLVDALLDRYLPRG